MSKFKISVRRGDDYEIEVDATELARLLGVPSATVAARLKEAGRLIVGEDVLMHVLRTNGVNTRAEQFERGLNEFTDNVASAELNQSERVKWIKTDRTICGVAITEL